MNISKVVWFNGKYVVKNKAMVPITTHALHYGTSIFEGIRAYWNSNNLYIFRLDDHIIRFRNSGKFYSISLKFSNIEIKKAIINLCIKNKMNKSCYIRPVYFIGEYGINLHVTKNAPTVVGIFMFPMEDLFDKNGITACISSWRKLNDSYLFPLAKMGGNYLNSILATQESKRNGYDEAILLDSQGNVSECPGENIFIIKNNCIITPSLSSSALDGITRDTVIKLSNSMGYNMIEKKITRSELYLSDEIFLTGTAAEITPIIEIDNKSIGDGKCGKITKELMCMYNKITTGKDRKFYNWITRVY